MSIYKSYEKYLVEADDDENAGGGGGQTVDLDADDDTTADAGNENPEENTDDQNQENNDNTDNQNNNDDNGNDDYDINDTKAGDDTTDDSADAEGNNTTADAGEEDGDPEAPEVENPGFDKIYDAMSPQEKSFHDHELRQQYKKLFKSINTVIEKTVALPRTSQTLEATTNLLHTLFSFKKYIIFYMSKMYESKTLIENTIEYWKYMSILSAYKSIYKELQKILIHDDGDQKR